MNPVKRSARRPFLSSKNVSGSNKLIRNAVRAEPLEPRLLFSTYTVNTVSDSLTVTPGILTFRQAVNDANAHAGSDTINFSPTVFKTSTPKTITLTADQVFFSDTTGTTTITGSSEAALTISGDGSDRVFVVDTGVNVSISNLTVANGAPLPALDGNVYGGGIYNQGTLTLNTVTVTKNTASGSNIGAYGGGIYSIGALTLSNCVVNFNNAYGSALGGPAEGGGIYATGSFSISNSGVAVNNAIGMTSGSTDGGSAAGGGIYLNCSSTATVTSTIIEDNIVTGGDGAPAFNGSGPFTGGTGTGGGIYAQTPLVVNLSTLTDNVVKSGKSMGTTSALAGGGGIFSATALTVDQSTLFQNGVGGGDAALMAKHGGSVLGGGILSQGTLSVADSNISGNTAFAGNGNSSGGPIPNAPTTGGSSYGGGIASEGTASISNTTLAYNIARGGTGSHAGISTKFGTNGGAGGAATGGGIWTDRPLTVVESTLTANNAIAGKGGNGYSYNSYPYTYLIAGTDGTAAGGGVTANSPVITNSILSGDLTGTASNDIQNDIAPSSANNLIGVGGGIANGVNGNKVGITNPKLSLLENWGGPTDTMVPLSTSPAINAGKNSLIPAGVTTDQRGLPRIVSTTVDIGAVEFSQLTITGSVFNDVNADGIKQSTEPALKNWAVYIDLTNVGVFKTGDPHAFTNAAGTYSISFSPITAKGPFIVREIPQTGWRRTDPAGLAPLGYYTVSSTAGIASNITFGNTMNSQVAGTVYKDANANGKLDTGETGLAGWTVYVDYLVGSTWLNDQASTLTDSKGNYSFSLGSGTFRIHELIKSGYAATSPGAAGYTLTPAAGSITTGENFGNK